MALREHPREVYTLLAFANRVVDAQAALGALMQYPWVVAPLGKAYFKVYDALKDYKCACDAVLCNSYPMSVHRLPGCEISLVDVFYDRSSRVVDSTQPVLALEMRYRMAQSMSIPDALRALLLWLLGECSAFCQTAPLVRVGPVRKTHLRRSRKLAAAVSEMQLELAAIASENPLREALRRSPDPDLPPALWELVVAYI